MCHVKKVTPCIIISIILSIILSIGGVLIYSLIHKDEPAIPVTQKIIVYEYYIFNVYGEKQQIEISNSERELLARILYREARGESIECQRAVISTIINRWKSGKWGNTIEEVIYSPGQFSTAKYVSSTTPEEEQYEVIDYILENGTTIPDNIIYFCAGGYFNWPGYTPYCQIDRTYFGY